MTDERQRLPTTLFEAVRPGVESASLVISSDVRRSMSWQRNRDNRQAARENDEAARRVQANTLRLLRGGRDGGHSGGMPPDLDARVKAFESRTSEMSIDLKAVIKDVSEIKGGISQMPTTFQMQAWFVGVALGLVALVFTIARAVK